MQKQHTPGPWHTGAFGNQIVYAADGWAVANAQVNHHQHKGFEEMQANASLIAAAPELLVALVELRDWYAEHTGLPAVSANAAIDKAVGHNAI